MATRKFPAAVVLAGLILAAVLFLVLKDDTADLDTQRDTDPTPVAVKPDREKLDPKPKPQEPAIPKIKIKDGEPVGGTQDLKFESGGVGKFVVVADAADELHFHGYDAYIDLVPGKPTTFSFQAEIEGLFELESHTTGTLMAEISVVPG